MAQAIQAQAQGPEHPGPIHCLHLGDLPQDLSCSAAAMASLLPSAVLVLFVVVFASPARAEPAGLDPAAFLAGDECAAGDGTCTLNALQVRGLSMKAQAEGEVAMHSNSSKCPQDTYGTCQVKSCAKSRGPAECWRTAGYKCLCPTGWCAVTGTCVPETGKCTRDTGGTCTVLGCKSNRGPTSCSSGKCMCEVGHCAYKGTCYPVTATGGSCKILGCSRSRGPTKCVGGKCICRPGHVSVNGVCHKQ
uniref:Uncharacterized protein n=1 Tax=Alexandrium monilatum TaxID=311494 RepID=A0A7S4QNQ0_9DINO